jgi:hypothetical protein
MCRSDILTLEEGVRSKSDFKKAWNQVYEQARKRGLPVIEGQVFSHASKGDDEDGLEFKPTDDDGGTLTQGDIVSLAKLPWAGDGLLTLAGCNTGLLGTRGWAPAQVFANSQGVTTVGQTGYAYFSKARDRYERIDRGSQNVYLWAYKRGQNAMLGFGARLPGKTFPAPKP